MGFTKDFDVRFRYHKYHLRKGDHHNPILQKAWNRFGEEAFLFEMLDHVTSECNLGEKEIEWSENLHSFCHERGYNIADTGPHATGGMRGKRHSEDTKKKLRAASLGKPKSEAHKRSMSECRKGKPLSEDTKRKRMNHKPFKKWSEERKLRQRGPGAPNFGRRFSEASRLKMSLSHMGKPSNNKAKRGETWES